MKTNNYKIVLLTFSLVAITFAQENNGTSKIGKTNNALAPQAPVTGEIKFISNQKIIAVISSEEDQNGESFGVLELTPATNNPNNESQVEGKLWKDDEEVLNYYGDFNVGGRTTTNTLTIKSGSGAGKILQSDANGNGSWVDAAEAGSIDELTDGKSTLTSNNVYLGFGAGASDNGNNNTANTALGINALSSFQSTFGSGKNTAFGFETMKNNSGNKNTAVGYQALMSGTTLNNENTAVGYQALKNNTGTGNVAIGYQAGMNFSGSNQLFIHNGADANPLIWGNFQTADVKINGNFEVTGSASKPGGGSWSSSSDVRLKDISGKYEKGLNEIEKLKTIKFRYKNSNPKNLPSDEDQYGFIAQEVSEIFPEAVKTDKDGYLTLNIHSIMIAMVNSIQELNTDKENLETILSDLEKENNELRQKFIQYEEKIQNIESKITNSNLVNIQN